MKHPSSNARIGYLGPSGTFTEEALLSQPDLRSLEAHALGSFSEVFEALSGGLVDYGFVAIENSIEGTVLATLDSLVFDESLLIQREVVLPIHQQLLGQPGAELTSIKAVYSYPHATAQCRRYLGQHLPNAEIVATNSTAQAARLVSETNDPHVAAIAPRTAAKLYGTDILAENIEDFHNNQTRFVLLHSDQIPPPSPSDKTSIACFQLDDRPGSLLRILDHFASRDINLTKLESRPSKTAMGEYCFVIDFVGHVAEDKVISCLEELSMDTAEVKFLGSYPASTPQKQGHPVPRDENWAQRRMAWLDALRKKAGRLA